MKKIYIALLLLFPFITKGQTITQADLPIDGTTFITAIDTSYHGTCGSQGQNQTWDFSMLVASSQDTSAFINAAGTLYESSFPSSNTAAYAVFNDTYSYYTNDATGFYYDGSIGLGGLIQVIPPILFVPVPFSFGDQRAHVSRLQFDTSYFDTTTVNLRIVRYSDCFYKVDATGTLTLPGGTYQNVLRVKLSETAYDTVYMDMGAGNYAPISDSQTLITEFRYFTTGSPTNSNYLLGITGDSLGTTASQSEFLFDPNSNVPVLNADKNDVKVFPNPAFNTLNFKNIIANANIRIFDNYGKLVMNSNGDIRSINVGTLPNGVYFYEVESKGKVDKGSFVIQH